MNFTLLFNDVNTIAIARNELNNRLIENPFSTPLRADANITAPGTAKAWT